MFNRRYTINSTNPEVQWEQRDVVITRADGTIAFEQHGVQVPATWSSNATTILAQKYFRGALGTQERETSLAQVIHRVVMAIAARGVADGYLVDENEVNVFIDELTYILTHQMASFNSPVWFNIGVEGVPQQASACFILSVGDEMESILNWYREEGLIFKGGSGAGVNLSAIRSSVELLRGGGTASGPVSFMRGADASAGTIKSGGKCLAPWQNVYTAEWGAVPVSELAERGDFTVLSYDPPAGRVKAKTARAWKSGVKDLVRIITDKGSFDLSVDHPVYLADLETVVPASELQAGNALLATSVRPTKYGYPRVWLRDGLKGRRNLHQLVGDDILGRGSRHVVHHQDHNKLNNAPTNLVCVTQAEHARLHGLELAAHNVHTFQSGRFDHSGRANGMHRSNSFWTDDAKSEAYRQMMSTMLHERGDASEMQTRASEAKLMNFAYKLINEGYNISTFEGYLAARRSHGGWDGDIQRTRKAILSRFGSYEKFHAELCARNHRVVSVTPLHESEVYDVEVDCPTLDDKTASSGHNFAIWANEGQFGTGIFVSNTRRAAKMVILNVDHPDIEEFIETKANEERKARALSEAGFDMGIDGKDIISIQYQNANNSVRVTDEFMEAVLEDGSWDLKAVTTGQPTRQVSAKDLMRKIAQAAWECADPGMQYDSTINRWHTTPNAGRINGSNPCFTGDTLVATADGRNAVRIDELVGTETPVYAKDTKGNTVIRTMRNVRMTRANTEIVDVMLDDATSLRCTPDHPFMLNDGSYIRAIELKSGDALKRFDSTHEPFVVNLAVPTNHKIVSVNPAGCADVFDGEVDELHNFAVVTSVSGEMRTAALSGVFVHNCSEYMSLDNSSCNLASLNLLKFLNQDGTFDVESFVHAARLVFTAQDILINIAEYPTEAIAQTTRSYRQLGLGYSNLGALLMTLGLPYDSDDARHLAATLTALMTGAAYRTSADLARHLGPFPGYAQDAEAVLQVLEMHRDALTKVDESCLPEGLFQATRGIWDETLSLAREYGVRNAQATLLAPTGTISFLMDCDTTGIEPAFSLVTYKKTIDGTTMVLPLHSVEVALERLGYTNTERESIAACIADGGDLVGSGLLHDEHVAVFATAVGPNAISAMGHLEMMAAVQPFLSGAISKTVNVPEDTSVEVIEDLYLQGWVLGLKAVAIYRDNCKVAQPLSSTKTTDVELTNETEIWRDLAIEAEGITTTLQERVKELEALLDKPVRQRLPRQRRSRTYAFEIGGAEGYATIGEYDDGRPGELFVKISKQGSTIAGVMDAFSIAVSLGLQHGVPLASFVRKFTNMRFEPAGITDDADLRIASSLVDYIFRRIAIDYLDKDLRSDLGIHTTGERVTELELQTDFKEELRDSFGSIPVQDVTGSDSSAEPRRIAVMDAPLCYSCGTPMSKTGSCYCCPSCGQSSGCS
jgi:ribonucleotide reductase alpha subunit